MDRGVGGRDERDRERSHGNHDHQRDGEARCHGEQIKYESGDSRDNLGFWTEPADWADWEFTVTKPGKFEVTTEVAAPERASFEVSIGEQKLKAEAQATGDYGRFRRLRIGTLEIAAPGKVTLALHAVPEGWHPLNVKSIRLTMR